MSSTQSLTAASAALSGLSSVGNLDDEDDNDDICPVCDGDCTCDNRSRPINPKAIQDSSSLKIKLIVPTTHKSRATAPPSSKRVAGDNASASTSAQALQPSVYENVKQRRRQVKNLSSADESAPATPKSLFQKRKASVQKTNTKKAVAAAAKLAATRKVKATKKTKNVPVPIPTHISSESELTDLDDDDDDDDDAQSGRFPTFVSASALSSGTRSEMSDSDVESGFGTDSSMEAEEEDHILSEERRKEHKSRKNSDWIIRSRPQSVGPGEVEMDDDSDATASADPTGYEHDDEEPMDEGRNPVYEHIMTGWSEDEEDESGADADLFFANLGESSGISSSGDDEEDDTDVGGLHDMDVQMSDQPAAFDFDLTRDWAAEGFPAQDDAHVAELLFGNRDTIIEASVNFTEMEADEPDSDALEETDGSTTEEDLVDEHGLPTPRAMKLFKWPQAISAINPMSTVSPSSSPARGRSRKSSIITGVASSPCPADILAGKVTYFGDSDEFDVDDDELPARGRSRTGPPRMGHFARATSDPMAVLDGTNKDVPSPFPRSKHRKIFSESSTPFERHRRSSLSESVMTSPDLQSDDGGATTTIELHDVLDASILEQSETADELDMSDSAHLHNMMRWNIPIGAFRDSRGFSVTTTPKSANFSPRVEHPTTSFGLKSSPFSMMWQNKKPPKGTRHRTRALPPISHAMGMSPVMLPVPDGSSSFQLPHAPSSSPQHHHHQQQQQQQLKTRKELRKELKSKRKQSQTNKRQQHHPNMKSRASSSIQRTNFFTSSGPVPPLNI